MITIEIRAPQDVPEGELRELLETAETATIAHEPAVLAALARAYGLKAEVLVARCEGRVAGALPLLRVRGPLGAVDSSVAYLDAGGPIGSREACVALVSAAARRALGRRAVLELRSLRESAVELDGAFVSVSREKDLLVRALPDDPRGIARDLDGKTRNHLRKALREGLWSESLPADDASLAAFRGVYARTMRDLGSPPHGLELFQRLARALGQRARVSLVRGPGGSVLAAALVLDDLQGQAVLPWAASDRRADLLEPNTLLYYEILVDATRRGLRRFSFGRSTGDSPQFRFKVRWGAVPVPLYWTTIARTGARSARPRMGDRLDPVRMAWRQLPLTLASGLGPVLCRWIAA